LIRGLDFGTGRKNAVFSTRLLVFLKIIFLTDNSGIYYILQIYYFCHKSSKYRTL